MSLLRAVSVFALGCFVWLSAAPVRADGLPIFLPPSYTVSGALLIVGDNACSGLPCTETVAFSFDFGYQFLGKNFFVPYVAHLLANGSGALGSFTNSNAGPLFVDPEMNHIGFGDTAGDEIDIHLSEFVVPAPVAPSIIAADLFSCATTTCLTDFAPQLVPLGAPQLGIFLGGSVESRVTAIPEPAMLISLVSGILLLGLRRAASAKF